MAIEIHNDSNQQFALRIGQTANQEISNRLSKIAAGLRIINASDDASGLAVAERLSSQSRGFNVANRNIQDFQSLAQTAEGGLTGIQDSLQRIRELSIQASNGTLTNDDRQLIQEEVSQLTSEIDRQAGSVQFNGQNLLDGTFSTTAQAGPNSSDTIGLNISETSASALGISGIDVSTQSGAESAIEAATAAVNSISTERADIGATVNRLDSAINQSMIAQENMIAAESRIRDADVASELIGLTTAGILGETSTFSLVQGNINRENAIRLLGD